MPLGFYLGLTLAVPFLRGAAGRADFGEHAWTVALVSGTMTLFWLALRARCRR